MSAIDILNLTTNPILPRFGTENEQQRVYLSNLLLSIQEYLDNSGAGRASGEGNFLTHTADATLPNSEVLTAGSGITLTPGAGTLTVSTTGGSGVSVLDRVLATTTLVNSSALTNLYAKSITNSDFNNGLLKLCCGGLITNATGSTQQIKNITLNYGGSAIWNENSTLFIPDDGSFVSRAWYMEVQAASTSSTSQNFVGFFTISDDTVGPTIGNGTITIAAPFNTPIQGSTGINTSSGAGTNTLALMWQFSAADPLLSISLTQASLLKI